mgnify:CR=1 FL=1
MATLGNKAATQHVSLQKQTITGNGGTSYSLQQSVGSALDIAVFVNNTRQEPTTAYSASGTTLTMTGAVNASDHFYVLFLSKAITTTGLPVDTVGTANISDTAVTNAKIANSTIDLTSKVTGLLAAANGGTGASTYNSGKTLVISSGDAYREPMFLLKLNGKTRDNISFGADLMLNSLYKGPSADLTQALTLNLGLNLTTTFATNYGTYDFKFGGVSWYRQSRLTVWGNRSFNRVSIFERRPQTSLNKIPINRYSNYYNSGLIDEGIRCKFRNCFHLNDEGNYEIYI